MEFSQMNEGLASREKANESERKVGAQSDDGAVIVGHDGFLFLIGGTNNVGQMYKELDQGVSDRWLDLVRSRRSTCAESGIKFLQVFIPEKSTLLSHLFPENVVVPSACYRGVKEKIAVVPDLLQASLFFEDVAVSERLRRGVFKSTDSHLTSLGAYMLFEAQVKLLGETVSFTKGETRKIVKQWDLGQKFCGANLVEEADLYESLSVAGHKMDPTLEHVSLPETGHVGALRVYRNPSAPIKKKVIAFANSFFWGGGTSLGQAWWFSRAFSEFHFMWSADLDKEYVREHGPDIVICQTIERFMRRVPLR